MHRYRPLFSIQRKMFIGQQIILIRSFSKGTNEIAKKLISSI